MKKLIGLIGAVFMAAATYAAPQYVVVTANQAAQGFDGQIAAGATSNNICVIDAKKQKDLAVQISFKKQGSGTDNNTITLLRSVDGTVATKDTATGNAISWVVAGNGTTTVISSTNVAMNGFGFLIVSSWVNGDSGDAVTNITIKAAAKIGAQ